MKKKLSILIMTFIFILSLNFAYGEEYNKLKPYEGIIKHNPSLYNLYKKDRINTYDYTFTTKDNHKITINGIVADKGQAIFLYSVQGKDTYKIKVNCESFDLENGEYVPSLGNVHPDGDKEYRITKRIGKLVPNKDNTITFSVGRYGEELHDSIEKFSIPFKESDFLETYVDYDKSIPLDNGHIITRLYSSPLGLVLNTKSTVSMYSIGNYRRLYYEKFDVRTAKGKVHPESGAHHINSEGVSLDIGSYDSIPQDTKRLYLDIDDSKYVIDLKLKEHKKYSKVPQDSLQKYYAKDSTELANLIGPNRIIYLEDKDYMLSDVTFNTEYLTSKDELGFRTFNISDVDNLTIVGKGNTRLISTSPYRRAVSFNNCNNIKLSNLEIGYDKYLISKEHSEEAQKILAELGIIANGNGVLDFSNTKDVTIENCRLFGGQIYGLSLGSNVKSIEFINSSIYRCYNEVLPTRNAKEITFVNSYLEINEELRVPIE